MFRILTSALLALLLASACGGSKSSAPGSAQVKARVPAAPATERSFAVATVEQYPNGLSLIQHPLGDSAAEALHKAGWSGQRYRDSEVLPSLFTGLREFPDLMVYGGHGTHMGPALTMDPAWTMVPQNYHWGASSSKPLRWFFNDSCIGLNDGVGLPDDEPRWDRVEGSYWYLGSWLQAMNWGNRGTHAYLAHRGYAYATGANTGAAYAIEMSLEGASVGQAWFEAALLDHAAGVTGLVPAVLSAYDPDTGRDWFDESLAAPWADPNAIAPVSGNSHRNLAYHYAVIGSPSLPAPSLAGPIRQIDETIPTPERLITALNGIPYRAEMTCSRVDMQILGDAPNLEALLWTMAEGRPTSRFLHFAQRGSGRKEFLGQWVAIRFPDGQDVVLRADAADKVVRASILKQPSPAPGLS